MWSLRNIFEFFVAIGVGGTIGWSVTRMTGVRPGRVETLLVILGLGAYWVSELRAERRRVAS